MAAVTVPCFDPATCSDSLLSSCYCAEPAPWEGGDLALHFLDEALPSPESGDVVVNENSLPPSAGAVVVEEKVCAASEEQVNKQDLEDEHVEVICIDPPQRLAISAPESVRRRREASLLAQRFVHSCRNLSAQAADSMVTLAASLSAREAELVKTACKRRGPRRRLKLGAALSRTTTSERKRLAWCTLQEMLGSSSAMNRRKFSSLHTSGGNSIPCPLSSPAYPYHDNSEKTDLSGQAHDVAERLGLDTSLASGLAAMFSRRPRCLQTLVKNLKLPLEAPTLSP